MRNEKECAKTKLGAEEQQYEEERQREEGRLRKEERLHEEERLREELREEASSLSMVSRLYEFLGIQSSSWIFEQRQIATVTKRQG